MGTIIDGEEWLSQSESARQLGWTWITFKRYSAGLPWQALPGKGIRKFYRKADVMKLALPNTHPSLETRLADVARTVLRNTPMDELTPEWQELKRLVEDEKD